MDNNCPTDRQSVYNTMYTHIYRYIYQRLNLMNKFRQLTSGQYYDLYRKWNERRRRIQLGRIMFQYNSRENCCEYIPLFLSPHLYICGVYVQRKFPACETRRTYIYSKSLTCLAHPTILEITILITLCAKWHIIATAGKTLCRWMFNHAEAARVGQFLVYRCIYAHARGTKRALECWAVTAALSLSLSTRV